MLELFNRRTVTDEPKAERYVKAQYPLAVRRVGRVVFQLLLRTFFRIDLRFTGDPSAYRQAPVLIISNHQAYLDGLLMWAFLPWDPVFVLHPVATRGWLYKLLLKGANYVVVDPMQPSALRAAASALRSGNSVMIFPEGRVTVTGYLMKIYDGVGLLLGRSGAPVAPVWIEGSHRTSFGRMPAWQKLERRARITITVFPPRQVELADRREAGPMVRQLLEEAQREARPKLSLAELFDETAEREGWDSTALMSERVEPCSYRQLRTEANKLRGSTEAGSNAFPNLPGFAALLASWNSDSAADDRLEAAARDVAEILTVNRSDRVFCPEAALGQASALGLALVALTGCRLQLSGVPLRPAILGRIIYENDCSILIARAEVLRDIASVASADELYNVRRVVVIEGAAEPDLKSEWMDTFGLKINELPAEAQRLLYPD